jgi:putative ubiquitin-RnfH superfamily antitoxin RatB of RatAB toxin-antitoxin module
MRDQKREMAIRYQYTSWTFCILRTTIISPKKNKNKKEERESEVEKTMKYTHPHIYIYIYITIHVGKMVAGNVLASGLEQFMKVSK